MIELRPKPPQAAEAPSPVIAKNRNLTPKAAA
jgi:hypothetical protein